MASSAKASGLPRSPRSSERIQGKDKKKMKKNKTESKRSSSLVLSPRYDDTKVLDGTTSSKWLKQHRPRTGSMRTLKFKPKNKKREEVSYSSGEHLTLAPRPATQDISDLTKMIRDRKTEDNGGGSSPRPERIRESNNNSPSPRSNKLKITPRTKKKKIRKKGQWKKSNSFTIPLRSSLEIGGCFIKYVNDNEDAEIWDPVVNEFDTPHTVAFFRVPDLLIVLEKHNLSSGTRSDTYNAKLSDQSVPAILEDLDVVRYHESMCPKVLNNGILPGTMLMRAVDVYRQLMMECSIHKQPFLQGVIACIGSIIPAEVGWRCVQDIYEQIATDFREDEEPDRINPGCVYLRRDCVYAEMAIHFQTTVDDIREQTKRDLGLIRSHDLNMRSTVNDCAHQLVKDNKRMLEFLDGATRVSELMRSFTTQWGSELGLLEKYRELLAEKNKIELVKGCVELEYGKINAEYRLLENAYEKLKARHIKLCAIKK